MKLLALLLIIATGTGWAAEESRFIHGADDLVKSAKALRTKKIPQAYFALYGAHIPLGVTFAPDGSGSAYLLVSRSKDVSAKESSADDWGKAMRKWKQGLAELGIASSVWPEFDRENRKITYWSDDRWGRLAKSMKPWTIPYSEVKGLHRSNQWDPSHLVVRIPKGKERTIVLAIIKDVLKLEAATFKCDIGWN